MSSVEDFGAAFLDRYSVQREIGHGGMATVYLARDLKHDREVAVKMLRPELSVILGGERFLNEIKIAAQLDHPHILTLIDSGEANGRLYYVLPYVRGESLRKRLGRERQLPVEDALSIARQVASALHYAHAKGVVHRDVKPENILIHEGEAILTDFGIALAVKHASGNRLTGSGISLGTPQYMSPEQASGDRALDARSDVYSLAAVLYEMLVGEPPHADPSQQVMIAKLLTERPTRLRVLRDSVPECVEDAVARALEKVPADRYLTAGQFARALETPVSRTRLRLRPWGIPVAAGVAVVALLALVQSMNSARPVLTPAVRRMQLTTNGNGYFPSVSPDGNRIAFAEKDCDDNSHCTYRLVVQDMDGTGRLVLTSGIANVWATAWTLDARFLLYTATYADTWGAYAVSTLGGVPRALGCCVPYPLTRDTIVVVPASFRTDTLVWIRYVTVQDGVVRDSIPVVDPGYDFQAFPTDDPRLIAAHIYSPERNANELRLIDRKGRVRSRIPIDAKFRMRARWLPHHSAVLLMMFTGTGSEFDLVRLRVDRGQFKSAGDTLMRGLQITSPNPEGWGWLSVAPDASQLVIGSAPYEATVWTFQRGTANRAINARRIVTATDFVWARVSRDGRRVVVGRTSTTPDGVRDRLFLTDGNGQLRPITPPLEDIRGVEWKADGSGLLVLNFVRDGKASVIEVDTSGRRLRELLRLDRGIANDLRTLRDGSFLLIGAEGREIRLLAGNGAMIKRWVPPAWMPHFLVIAADWSDSNQLALCSYDKGAIHVIVTRLNMHTGTFSPPVRLSPDVQLWGRLTQLDDGQLVLSALEGRGTWGLYRISENAIVRLGELPQLGGFLHTTRSYTISGNGRRLAATAINDRSDVFAIRNFGDMLRQ